MNELRRGKTSLAYDESEIYLLAKLLLLLKMTAKLTQLLPPQRKEQMIMAWGGYGEKKLFRKRRCF